MHLFKIVAVAAACRRKLVIFIRIIYHYVNNMYQNRFETTFQMEFGLNYLPLTGNFKTFIVQCRYFTQRLCHCGGKTPTMCFKRIMTSKQFRTAIWPSLRSQNVSAVTVTAPQEMRDTWSFKDGVDTRDGLGDVLLFRLKFLSLLNHVMCHNGILNAKFNRLSCSFIKVYYFRNLFKS